MKIQDVTKSDAMDIVANFYLHAGEILKSMNQTPEEDIPAQNNYNIDNNFYVNTGTVTNNGNTPEVNDEYAADTSPEDSYKNQNTDYYRKNFKQKADGSIISPVFTKPAQDPAPSYSNEPKYEVTATPGHRGLSAILDAAGLPHN